MCTKSVKLARRTKSRYRNLHVRQRAQRLSEEVDGFFIMQHIKNHPEMYEVSSPEERNSFLRSLGLESLCL